MDQVPSQNETVKKKQSGKTLKRSTAEDENAQTPSPKGKRLKQAVPPASKSTSSEMRKKAYKTKLRDSLSAGFVGDWEKLSTSVGKSKESLKVEVEGYKKMNLEVDGRARRIHEAVEPVLEAATKDRQLMENALLPSEVIHFIFIFQASNSSVLFFSNFINIDDGVHCQI